MFRTLMGRSLFLLPLLAALVLIQPEPVQGRNAAEESDEYFKSGKILNLEIEIGPKEADALRREPRKYVKAQLKEEGKVVGRDI